MAREELAECGHPLYWHNCYKGSSDLWSPDAFIHPAKMSIPLAFRIMEHLKQLGLLSENDTILDPMAGISTTGVVAGALGHKFIGVELEEKFVELSKKNKEYAERRLFKSLDWQLIKGDSRNLSHLLQGDGLKSVTSHPYTDGVINMGGVQEGTKSLRQYVGKDAGNRLEGYGETEGQIGNLKDTPLKSITSPPYANRVDDHGVDQEGFEGFIEKLGQYGETDGQIGHLKDKPLKSITSPPYQDSQGHPSLGSVNKDDWGKEGKDIVKRRGLSGEYGDTKGQVGKLKSIISPPYGNRVDDHGVDQDGYEGFTDKLGEYGNSDGQIGHLKDKPLKSITSPPFEDSLPNGLDRKAAETMVKAMYEKHGRTYSKEDFEYQVELILKRSNREYGESDGQIGKLKDTPLKSIMSPPYADAVNSDKSGIDFSKCAGGRDRTKEGAYNADVNNITNDLRYSPDPGNIGNLADRPLKSITSPPYDGHPSASNSDKHPDRQQSKPAGRQYGDTPGQIGALKSVVSLPYGDIAAQFRNIGSKLGGDKFQYGSGDEQNIGNLADESDYQDKTKAAWWRKKAASQQSESYLEAMLKVYKELALVSDCLTVVVKNPTRGGQLRRLDLDTEKILLMAGWTIHCRHRVLLFEELEQSDLFGETKKKVKGRISFFKRLSYVKGNPVASWEDIIVAVRK